MDQIKLIQVLAVWVVNAIVLLVSASIFPGNVVLGNATVTKPLAGVLGGLVLTLVIYLVIPLVAKIDFKIKNENAWYGIFYVGNFLVVWIIKRFADFTGLGVSSILFVIFVAALLTLGQWAVFKVTGGMKPIKAK